MGVISWFGNLGRGINSVFNTVKNFGRGVGNVVKSVAGAVSGGAKLFSFIPGIGSFAAGVGAVADGVSKGVDFANSIFDAGEGIQKQFGLNTGAPTAGQSAPAGRPQPTGNRPRPIATAVTRRRVAIRA